ncbi:MAG: polysaccharide deacetylase family protein [Clostridia bacterium]|nr:polysaccharide deacetylase family protein [Clostridia bacterium]
MRRLKNCPPFIFSEITDVTVYYPGYTNKAVTFSYDDGLKLDAQLVSLFNEYGIKATFNLMGNSIPTNTSDLAGYVAMYEGHEVANHSMTHPDMSKANVTLEAATNDIVRGRDAISAAFGNKFNTSKWGFVWPYSKPGRGDIAQLEQNIKDAGAVYIRPVSTTNSFDLPTDWFLWEPTCKDAYLKDGSNYDYMTPLTNAFIADNTEGLRLLYIWGHAADLATKKYGAGYSELEAVLTKLTGGGVNIWSATNMEIYDYVNAANAIQISADGTRVENNSDIDVYASLNGQNVIIPAHGYSAL